MPWHSTRRREELLIVVAGRVQLEVAGNGGDSPEPRRIRVVSVKAGQTVFLPSDTMHQVVNRSPARARYIYVTAPLAPAFRRCG